jgi:hypothetical protein
MGQRIPPAADTAVRDGRSSEMVWTLKSSLVRDSIPKSIKSGGSSHENDRRSQNYKGQKIIIQSMGLNRRLIFKVSVCFSTFR